jgi:hypothetical protein
VTIPDTAVVGPPETFPLVVELLDSNTGQRVTTQDRLFDIRVMSAQTGLAGAGAVEVGQGILSGGIRTVYQAYSRAEDIFIQVSDTTGITGISNTCRMLADGFKRIQIVAPGETPDPGALTGNGKLGEVLTQQAEVPFTLTLRAVDQYWNLADDVSDGTVNLSSSGGQLDVVDPADQGAPFINGGRDVEVVLGNPGVVAVFATDPAHPAASSGRVDIPVNEAEYRVILPDPAVVTAGPPATFTVTVRLENPETGARIAAGGSFEMTAVLPDRSGAHDTLGIGTATLVDGEAVVSGQHYATSEQIVIRVRDDRGRESFSDVLTVVPEGVRYELAVPDTVTAGRPFGMSVRRVDIVTGQLVTSDDRNFTLRAFSGNSPRPDFNLTPAGILADSVGTTAGGERVFTAQTYDRAETIYLEVSDGTGEQAYSDVIVVMPAPPAIVELWAEDIPGHVLDRALRPAETVMMHVRATDEAGNAVQHTDVMVQIISGDGTLGSAKRLSTTLIADVDGRAAIDMTVVPYGTRDIRLQALSSDLASQVVLLEVIGPPVTTVSLEPDGSSFRDGYYVTPQTEISLSATTEDPGGIQTIFVDVDTADPPRPVAVYAGPFSLADLGAAFSGPGQHTLRFYAEETSGVVEAVRTVVLYTAQDMDTQRQITNRPNPFNPRDGSTMILFRPPASGAVTLTLYDLYGDVVYTDQLVVNAGELVQYPWDGRNGQRRVVANGGYICRIHGSGMDLRRKIAVVK